MLHLLRGTTIKALQAPRVAIFLQEHSLQECGFTVLINIIKELSPQLGGAFRDLQEYVTSLKVIDGEPVLEYYLRALKMQQEIQL